MNDLIIYLLAMVVVVPISKRFGLGSVIGYLIAGALIGTQGLSLLHAHEGASEIAEFGIIMMLLLIGLELNLQVLWKMRGPIFGLGGMQVVGTSILFAIGHHFCCDVPWQTSLAVGMILSVSSTAIVMQTLQEKGYAKSTGGDRAFSVLLFQDMAVIPILALFPVLGAGTVASEGSPYLKALSVLGAVVAVVLAGRFLVRPVFKIISRSKLREAFTALALLIVLSAAALMHYVGLSPALGAFLAGVVLADSEFRHQIEADIEPFKGILLGLFFITVGSNIRFDLITEQPIRVAEWVLAIVAGKAALIYALGRWCKLRPPESLLFGVSLAQGGEFAFVLIAQAGALIDPEMGQILTASVALSMAIAPILISLTIKHGMSRLECMTTTQVERAPDIVDESEKMNPVIVVGIGRFGQTLTRFLRANGFTSTVLDIDSEQIDIMARFGIKSYFGDGSNPDLLRAAGLEQAKLLVLAVDEPETAIKIAETLRPLYPKLPIYSRAYDRLHAYKLLNLGVTEIAIETSGSAMTLGMEVLQALGLSRERAFSQGQLFYINNQSSIHTLAKHYHTQDRESFIQLSRQMSEQLEAIMKTDPEQLLKGSSSQYPPPPEQVQ